MLGAAEDVADPATWIIDEGGVGPFALGADVIETLEGADGLSWSEHLPDDGELGRFFRVPEGDNTGTGGKVWISATDDGEIVSIRVQRSDEPEEDAYPPTADGLTIGSTRSEIEAVHGDLIETPDIGATLLQVPRDQNEPGPLSFMVSGAEADAVTAFITVARTPPPDR